MKLYNYELIKGNQIDLKLLKKNSGNVEKGWSAEYRFQIQLHNSNTRIGHLNFRLEDNDEVMNYIGHIGYSVIKEHRGHKYSVKTCHLLKKVMKDHQMKRIIITCNPEKYASRNTCEMLGAKLLDIVNVPKKLDCYSPEESKKCRYEWYID
jgi:tagatose 1,6-diphosphate aldolase